MPYDFDAALRSFVLEVGDKFSEEPGQWLETHRESLFAQALRAVNGHRDDREFDYNGQVPEDLEDQHQKSIVDNTTPTRPQEFKDGSKAYWPAR